MNKKQELELLERRRVIAREMIDRISKVESKLPGRVLQAVSVLKGRFEDFLKSGNSNYFDQDISVCDGLISVYEKKSWFNKLKDML